MNHEEIKKVIRRLKPSQFDTFSRICIGDDRCLHPSSAKALARRGLIEYEAVPDYYKGITYSVWRAQVASIPVHRAWAEVCSETYKGEDDDGE